MKRIAILTTILLCSRLLFSQDRHEPPRQVRESFQHNYPSSQARQWNRSASGWSVDFEDRDHQYGEVTVHFDGRGRETDRHIPFDRKDVPDQVYNRVHDHYEGSAGYAFTRIDRPDQQQIYEVHLRHHNRNKTVYVDGDGREHNFRDRH